MIPRRGVKIKFFLSVVIYVVKAAFVPFSAIGEKSANACAARLCGISPYPVPDTATALPNLSGILFPLVYSGFRRFLICFTYSLTLLSPLFPGIPAPSVVIYVVKNASRPVSGEDSPEPDRKRLAFQVVCIVTLRRVLCKWFLRRTQLKVCGAINKETGADMVARFIET